MADNNNDDDDNVEHANNDVNNNNYCQWRLIISPFSKITEKASNMDRPLVSALWFCLIYIKKKIYKHLNNLIFLPSKANE